MEWTKSSISEFLKDGIVQVSFTKADGSHRDMRCTLKNDLLPPAEEGKQFLSEYTAIPNDEYVRVFDIDKQAWRSFRIDSINNVLIG